MTQAPAQWLICEDYAKTLGVTGFAIRRAIDSGRIPPSAVSRTSIGGRGGKNGRTLINKTEADPAWALSHNPAHFHSPEVLGAVERIKAEMERNGEYVPPPLEPTQTQDDKGHISLAEANRREKVAKAHSAQLDFLEKKGLLVRKETVNKQLFEAGQQLSEAILSVPGRIRKRVAKAGGDEFEIERIILDELTQALEGLEEIFTRKIG